MDMELEFHRDGCTFPSEDRDPGCNFGRPVLITVPLSQPEYHGRVIALEGLIGAGKSTLVDKIQRSDPDIEVLKEQINPALLELFYSNPVKYGFAMQWAALQHRIYQSRLLDYSKKLSAATTTPGQPGKDHVWDRSMLGDYAFALWNHLTGNLDSSEMEAYESMFGASVSREHPASLAESPFVSHVDTYVWLVDDPKQCKRRVELRQSNPAEQGIPDQYYQGLEDVHIFLFLKLLSDPSVNYKVKVRNWEQYHQVSSLEELLKDPVAAPHRFSADTLEMQDRCKDLGVIYSPPNLTLDITFSKEGVKQDVIDKYGFYFLTEDSKVALYQYLSSGGDPMCICMSITRDNSQ